MYLGNYYEVETDGSTTTRRYYDAGAVRVAMRENDLDAAVSFSQFKYDLDRFYGTKSGEPIEIYNTSSGLPSISSGFGNLLNQVIWKDWW